MDLRDEINGAKVRYLFIVSSGEVISTARLHVRGSTGTLSFVHVVPRWRGKGVGKRTISLLLRKVRREMLLRNVSLQVDRDNSKACSLYRRLRFRVVGDPDASLLSMRKQL